jgi:hypothetical protein
LPPKSAWTAAPGPRRDISAEGSASVASGSKESPVDRFVPGRQIRPRSTDPSLIDLPPLISVALRVQSECTLRYLS